MITINDYLNEHLDESRKICSIDSIKKGIDKILAWNKPDNIKKLMSEYMSEGDAEEFSRAHWNACVKIVEYIADSIMIFISDSTYVDGDRVDSGDMTDWICDTFDDPGNGNFIKDINKRDKSSDWDEDACIDLFNTVSIKVCKEAWLI